MQCVGNITESQDSSLLSEVVVTSYSAIEAILLSIKFIGK
jgi:hypothetical protein